MSEKLKLKISTVTPVTIGSGVELSPYADYIIDNSQICFIDKKVMQNRILSKGGNYLDNFIYGVANGIENNRSEFDLKSFLLDNKIVNDIDEIVSLRTRFTANIPKSKLPIKGIIKTPLQEPYVPGSSVKGALKTILMYNWLKTNNNADRKIYEVINGKFDDGRYKKVGFDWLEKLFESKVDDQSHQLIRPNTIQQITDSKPFAKESTIVVDCYRKLPIRFECIAKDNTAEFELILANYAWDDLARQANNYAYDVLNRELDLVNDDDNLVNYYNQLVDIQDLINDELGNDNANTAYLRIGFGKGYYLNSLGIAIFDYVTQSGKEDLYNKFEQFIRREFTRKDKSDEVELKNFPKTRLFVTKTQEPLGWVRVERM